MRKFWTAVFLIMAVSACGNDARSTSDAGTGNSGAGASADVRPADFALIPCSEAETTICVLALAGGKRLLFGAPAGVGNRFQPFELAHLDGLFLLSLRGEDMEGLDEVRNVGWQAGRPGLLDVTGPDGVGDVIDALNRAYEVSDALIFVEDGAPAGGFDAALLSLNREISDEALVFDSGDLKVHAVSRGSDRVSYRVTYRDLDEAWYELLIRPCDAPAIGYSEYATLARNRSEIVCENGAFGDQWPFGDTWFLTKSDR
jgi:hypothetical protein